MVKNILKISSIIIVVILGIFIVSHLSKEEESDSDGYINFILLDENEIEVINTELPFYIGDSLFDVIDRNYDVSCADEFYNIDETCSYVSVFGVAILSIEDVKTDWNNNFLSLYQNGVYANKGVSTLSFESGDVIEFRWTDLS